MQQAARALDRDLVIFRARLAEEIVVGGSQMPHGGDAGPVMLTQDTEAFLYTFIGSDIDGYGHAVRRRRRRCIAVETHNIVEALAQPSHQRGANSSVGAADQDDIAFWLHSGTPIT